MATIVIPFRPNGKQRLAGAGPGIAQAMLVDVLAACEPVARTVIAGGEGGQGAAVQEALVGLKGPVAIVNADLPCASPAAIRRLAAAGFALVEAEDGTTNALSLPDPSVFAALYGPGSAARFRAHAPFASLAIPELAADVDTGDDLERLAPLLGPRTRVLLAVTA